MSHLLKYKYYDTPEGEDIFLKTIAASKYAGAAGLVLGTYDILMYSHPKGVGSIMARMAYFVGPMVGMASTFSVSSNICKNMRGKDDKINSFIGGALAGGLLSIWQKSGVVAFPAMVILGIAAVIKKTAVEENWQFFPTDVGHATKTIQSVRHDWTFVKDVEELKGFTTGN